MIIYLFFTPDVAEFRLSISFRRVGLIIDEAFKHYMQHDRCAALPHDCCFHANSRDTDSPRL